jgi:ferrous iron transport protein B
MVKNLKPLTIALAGNPNSGKTSLFNAIAGTNLKVGNWPGVTVERYEGYVNYKGYRIKLVDLPGTYSLNAYSPEETVARDFIAGKKADIVINVVDGSNLERNLYLTHQLMELEPEMVIALNMYDEVIKNGITIDFKYLQKLLGCHIVPVSAVTKKGIDSLLDHVVRVYEKKIPIAKNKIFYSEEVEESLAKLKALIETDTALTLAYGARWLAVKLFENDEAVYRMLKEKPVWVRLEGSLGLILAELESKIQGKIPEKILEDRYAFVRGAVKETVKAPNEGRETLTDKIDSVLIGKYLGLPIFLLIMWLIFQMTFVLGKIPMGWIASLFNYAGLKASIFLPEGNIRSIVVDGVIAGVGGVVVFIPNIMLLFLGLSFLEATGYMARAAFVVDKVFHKMGLHGKSFIPMVTGFGCSVPAFMACRTLKNRSDRLATMMVIPFMSCGAKLPVYVLLIGAFFPEKAAGNILFGVYLFGILVAVLSAKLFKSTIFKGQSEPFVMELPVYRMPSFKSVLMQMWLKAWMYIKKAGTTILAASLIIWFAANYPQNRELENGLNAKIAALSAGLGPQEKIVIVQNIKNEYAARHLEYSFAGRIGKAIEPVLKPLGFDWRIGTALLSGLAAKEIVVSTMGTIYSMGAIGHETGGLAAQLRNDKAYNPAVALALIVFVLLYVPCLAATAVFHKEAGELKMTLFYIAYAMGTAWVMAFVVYRAALLFVR